MIPEAHLQSACCDLIADVARSQGKVHLKVAGASMVPALWPGDVVTVRRCEPGELRAGSIIVFRQNQRLVVHRLMHWREGCVVTRGDSHPCLDRPTPGGDVIGRVESIERDGREVSSRISFRQSVVGFILRRSRRAIWHYMRAANWMRRFERGGSAEPGIPQALG
jgi:signal peptidase I